MRESVHVSNLPTIELSGMTIAVMGAAATVDYVLDRLAIGIGGWLLATNLDLLRRFVVDGATRAVYSRADICVADGMPLVWASWIKGTPLPERVAGSNLILPLCQEAGRQGRSIYLLGGDPDANAGTAERLKAECPGLVISGRSSPSVNAKPTQQQIDEIGAVLEAARPDIVFVAMGTPKQELVIDALRGRFPAVWWIGVGASFSFLAGQISRAPLQLQKVGLEWAHRLLQEPGRLSRRYIVDDLPFAFVLMASAVRDRFRLSMTQARVGSKN